MVSGPSYQRLGTTTDGLLFKYKLAKALTIVSLLAVIVMALGSLVYPGKEKKGPLVPDIIHLMLEYSFTVEHDNRREQHKRLDNGSFFSIC